MTTTRNELVAESLEKINKDTQKCVAGIQNGQITKDQALKMMNKRVFQYIFMNHDEKVAAYKEVKEIINAL